MHNFRGENFWELNARVTVLALSPYYLRLETTIRLAFKFYPTKIVHLDFSNVYLI